MSRARSGTMPLTLLLFGGALTACPGTTTEESFEYPRGELSATTIEFGSIDVGDSSSRTVWFQNQGELPMGVDSITLGENDRSDQFSFTYSLDEVVCPEEVDTGTAAEAAKAEIDSGGDGGSGDTEPATDLDLVTILDPGCRMPVDISFQPDTPEVLWGSLKFTTVSDTIDETNPADVAEFHSDPSHMRRTVLLQGEGERGVANLVVSPMRYDFGHLWTGDEEKAYISIRNSGDGELTIYEPYTDESCDAGFSVSSVGFSGSQTTLAPSYSTFVEITFTPEDTDEATCELNIDSSDEDTSSVEVALQANAGADPNNQPPTVVIRDPGIGHLYSGSNEYGTNPLTMEINIFDVNQPADTLYCKVKSMVLGERASVANCAASDDSGHIFVEIDPEEVGNGVDTLKVQVTDASEIISYASISVLFNAGFPESDDDGDGWGDEQDADENGNYDCDDLNANTYPYAAEVPDGFDNDCDGIADEGTTAYDDDGDSFTEEDGDCNDYDIEVYPGARELSDDADNDCDGIVDESTSTYDDDGDGFTEMNGDCDDDEADVHPSAVEYCDGIDNDCNGLKDYQDACIELTSQPYIVGGVVMQQTACEPGDKVSVSVFVYDADGQNADYAWTGDEGLTIDPLTGSPSVTVTCPSPGDEGKIYGLYVVATDEDGNAVWEFDDIAVYPDKELYKTFDVVVKEEAEGCGASTAAVAPALSLAWLALLGVAARRRED